VQLVQRVDGFLSPSWAGFVIAPSSIAPNATEPWPASPLPWASRRRGEEAIERVRELTDGLGAHSVLECVGVEQAVLTALEIVRRGGALGRVGVPQEETFPGGVAIWKNVSVGGGTSPARAYIEELRPDVLEGKIEPGRVFDRVANLDGVPDGYRAMNDREAIKVFIEL
jgi:threonine dehydrogenase-like Zn-dependent dehydrogenase